jgi:hypothetical protein
VKYLKGYVIAALAILVVAACSTTQNAPQRQGDTHLEALASPSLSTLAAPGTISWTFNDNLNVEIVGAGMGHAEAVLNNPATLNIADTSTIQKIVLVAVVKGGSDLSGSPHLYPPTTVTFTVNGTVYDPVGPTHTTNFGWHHELVVPFASAPASPLAVSAKVNDPTNNKGGADGIGTLYSPRSFTAFVSRTASASRPASSGSIPHADLWWYHGRVDHTVDLAIPTTTGPRDVNVSFALTELTNERTAVVEATADGVTPVSRTFTVADNNKGAELAIHTLTLTGVPADASNVRVTFTSPRGDVYDFVNTGGDSFFVTGVSATSDVPPPPSAAVFLIIDEDGIDNGDRYWLNTATSFTPSTIRSWTANDVNDDRPGLAQRLQLRFFANNVGKTYWLWTGQVGDEGWFAPKVIPSSWASAGPTTDGLRNFLGNPSQPFPHNVGPGLGTSRNPERLLDEIPHVIPLRAEGLWGLRGKTVCALVWDSDISINYDQGTPLGINGNLQGEKLGVVAFDVLDVVYLGGFSSSTLPRVQVTIRNANEVCEGPLTLYTDAPEPRSSSQPMDIRPNDTRDNSGYTYITR